MDTTTIISTLLEATTIHDDTATRKSNSRQYPMCTEIFCDLYFTSTRIWSISLMGLRFGIAVLILLLGLKMEKDYMRSITNTMFLSIMISELFTIYIEVASYIEFFTTSKAESQEFVIAYIAWTKDLLTVMNDYVHINVLVMLPLLLYCGTIATLPGDRINAFPTNTICLIVQVVPFFVCILNYVRQINGALVLQILGATSKIVTIICFGAVLVQIIMSIVVLMRELPYEAATSTDMQIRDARSRLMWSLFYMILPFLTLIPFVIEAVFYIFQISTPKDSTSLKIFYFTQLLIYIIHFYRPLWMVLITMFLLPPYRRAFLLVFCQCPCCPKVDVEPLPRKANDTLMYRYADI